LKSDRQRDVCALLPLTLWPLNVEQTPSEASMSKANEWDLLKRQFDALTHDDSVGCVESIDEIFDVQFRRRFTELINQTAQRNSTTIGYNWPRL
jgi:hypothetical protein